MTQILHIQMILSFVKIKASFLFCTPPFPFPPFPSPSPPPIIRRATPVYTIRDLWHDILYYYRGNCSQVVLYRAITFLTPIIFIVFTLILFEWRHFHRHPPIPHTHSGSHFRFCFQHSCRLLPRNIMKMCGNNLVSNSWRFVTSPQEINIYS